MGSLVRVPDDAERGDYNHHLAVARLHRATPSTYSVDSTIAFDAGEYESRHKKPGPLGRRSIDHPFGHTVVRSDRHRLSVKLSYRLPSLV